MVFKVCTADVTHYIKDHFIKASAVHDGLIYSQMYAVLLYLLC